MNFAKIKFIDRNKVIKELKSVSKKLKKENKGIENIFLFGSLAKGNYTGISDADLLIILKHTNKDFVERIIEFKKYFFNVGIEVEPFVYTEDEIKKMIKENNSFIKSIKKDCILLC